MRMREGLVRVTRVALRRPVVVLVTVFVLALAGGLLALTLRPSAGIDTLADQGSGPAKATHMLHERFGDDAIVILVKGPVTSSVLTSDLGRLVGLEGCIGGNVPRGVTPRGGPNGPCARLGRDKPVQVVYGPGTFLNEAVGRLSDEIAGRTRDAQAQATRAAEAARRLAKAQGASKKEQDQAAASAQQLVSAQFVRYAAQIALRYGIPLSSQPSIDNRQLVSSIVFDPSRGAAVPKSRFAYLFPNANASIIQVRLKPGLSDDQRTEAIRQIRKATAMKVWRPKYGATYTVTGAPVLVDAL